MLQANFMALCFIEPQLRPLEVFIVGIGIFDLICSCDFDLDLMTLIYKADPHSPH